MKNNNRDKIVIISLVIILLLIVSIMVIIKIINNNKLNKSYEIDNSGEVYYEIKKNKANEYKIMNVDEEFIINSYFNYIKKILVNDKVKAYQLLNKSDLDKYKTQEEFDNYVNKIISDDFLNRSIQKYNISGVGTRVITIIDDRNYKYVINEDGVWNIKYSIIGQLSLE